MSSPEDELAKLRRDHFREDLGELDPSTRQVLEQYSKIPPADVLPHVYDIRERAWRIRPYPCIGRGTFLDLTISNHSDYPEILRRMKDEQQIVLDLGCAFGQAIRRLVYDGVDSTRCYGSDLRLEFIDLGYELFNDKDSLKSEFIAADIFDPSSPLSRLDGQVDIILANSFFHLFTYEQQVQSAKAAVRLLKPREGSMIVGRQMGSSPGKDVQRKIGGGSRFLHDEATWKTFWDEIGEQVGAKFDVTVRRLEFALGPGWQVNANTEHNPIRVEFCVRRRG